MAVKQNAAGGLLPIGASRGRLYEPVSPTRAFRAIATGYPLGCVPAGPKTQVFVYQKVTTTVRLTHVEVAQIARSLRWG